MTLTVSHPPCSVIPMSNTTGKNNVPTTPTLNRPTVTSVELPAGDYYVGDPCYAFDGSWNEACDLMDFEQPRRHVEHITLTDGRWFAFTHTAYGDGGYEGDDGYTYGVDAGILGIVPVASADTPVPTPNGLNRVTFDQPFTLHGLDDVGDITIGHITIATDPDDDERECIRCGTTVEVDGDYCWSCEDDNEEDDDE